MNLQFIPLLIPSHLILFLFQIPRVDLIRVHSIMLVEGDGRKTRKKRARVVGGTGLRMGKMIFDPVPSPYLVESRGVNDGDGETTGAHSCKFPITRRGNNSFVSHSLLVYMTGERALSKFREVCRSEKREIMGK